MIIEKYNKDRFEIEGTVLKRYRGVYNSEERLVRIPSGITEIGQSAFIGYSVTDLIIPDSVVSINKDSFQYCWRLKSITVESGNSKYHSEGNCLIETSSKTLILGATNCVIPADGSATTIGEGAFKNRNIETILIPDCVTAIGKEAFSGCLNLKYIKMPKQLKEISDSAFCGCENLESLELSDSITSIGAGAFSDCCSLKNIHIPESITKINQFSFSNCFGLARIVIPQTVKSINYMAFAGCFGLSEITIPEGVKVIGSCAFATCNGLTQITIPKSVKIMDKAVFNGCCNLDINCVAEKEPKGWKKDWLGATVNCKIVWNYNK